MTSLGDMGRLGKLESARAHPSHHTPPPPRKASCMPSPLDLPTPMKPPSPSPYPLLHGPLLIIRPHIPLTSTSPSPALRAGATQRTHVAQHLWSTRTFTTPKMPATTCRDSTSWTGVEKQELGSFPPLFPCTMIPLSSTPPPFISAILCTFPHCISHALPVPSPSPHPCSLPPSPTFLPTRPPLPLPPVSVTPSVQPASTKHLALLPKAADGAHVPTLPRPVQVPHCSLLPAAQAV